MHESGAAGSHVQADKDMRRFITLVLCGGAFAAVAVTATQRIEPATQTPGFVIVVNQSPKACERAARKYAPKTAEIGSFKTGCAAVRVTYPKP